MTRSGEWNATLFGEVRPPFAWMRLSLGEQSTRLSDFYRIILGHIAEFPALDVKVTYADGVTARAIATASSLSIDGRTLRGSVQQPRSLERLADGPWEEITITTASRPLLSSTSGERVTLWLDPTDAAQLRKALAPVLNVQSERSPSRTRSAAGLLALNWILLGVYILIAVSVARTADRWVPFVLAAVVGVLIALALIWPLQAIGRKIQRRYYGSHG